ncbi:MAG: thioredoxin family protein [Candidatus Aminicenantes bacterium]|nr:MAG: thioredoxin family protein [Candidatus Aminicenantes bacterium]
MSRKPIIISGCVLMMFIFTFPGILGAREKTEKIGNISWYTEQNTFDEIVNIAKKENKQILAVFSATWCGPCKAVKKKVFATDDFQKVADRVVLLYIEETDPKSKEYLKKNKIIAFPTFKIFSKDGIELDSKPPERTLEGFLEWIDDVKAGNSYYELSLKLKKDPNHRELVLKLVDRVTSRNIDERIKLLRRAIQLNPDFNDPLSQEAYENLASALGWQMMRKREEDRKNYASKNNQEFMTIINAYYPDKFKYRLKGDRLFYVLLRWLNGLGDFQKALSYFDDFLKTRGNKIDVKEDIYLFPMVFSSLLRANREKQAEEWLAKLQNLVKKDTEAGVDEAEVKKKEEEYSYWLWQFYNVFIEYYGEKGLTKKAEKYAALIFDLYVKIEAEQSAEFTRVKLLYAKKYLVFADEVVKELEEKIKTAEGKEFRRLALDLAAIYARMGKTEKARKYLYDLYENQSLVESLDEKKKASFYNSIAWTMLDAKIVEEKTLEIAEKAVKLDDTPHTLDTLATVHAELGNFQEAIKIEEKALKLEEERDYLIEQYKKKLEKWKKKIK